MLRRDNSEYQWFRERAASVHTNLKSEYPAVDSTSTSTMSTAHKQVSLNAEPANPEDRAHEHFPPKSYADAAHEAVDDGSSQSVNDNDYKHVNGNAKHSDSGTSSRKSSHDTNTGKHIDEDKLEFEKYLDDNGSVLVSVKPDPSYEENLKHNRETAPRSREPSRSDSDRSKQPEPSRQQDTTKSQLKAGREAGAGWERSAYVPGIAYKHYMVLTHTGYAGLL